MCIGGFRLNHDERSKMTIVGSLMTTIFDSMDSSKIWLKLKIKPTNNVKVVSIPNILCRWVSQEFVCTKLSILSFIDS